MILDGLETESILPFGSTSSVKENEMQNADSVFEGG